MHAALGGDNLRLEVDDVAHVGDRPLHVQLERVGVAQALEESRTGDDADDLVRGPFRGRVSLDDDHSDEIGGAFKETCDLVGGSIERDALVGTGELADDQTRIEPFEE
jgi:hypothetical protein